MGRRVIQRGSCRSIRLLALAALLSGGLAACGAQSGAASSPTATPTSSTTSTPTSPPALQLSITFLHRVDAENGWAAGPASVLRTADGGTHWLLVTPPGCSSPTADIGAAAALDATNLWFICAQGNPTGSLTFAVYHTSTGGQRWQSTPLTLAPPTVSVGDLTFADPSQGWLADWQGVATGHHFVALYRTTDGGATWSQAVQTDRAGGLESGALGDGPAFLDDTTGWFGATIGNSCTAQYATW
jgi:photosystem II stability/assembly factor-like uncharacterized protein